MVRLAVKRMNVPKNSLIAYQDYEIIIETESIYFIVENALSEIVKQSPTKDIYRELCYPALSKVGKGLQGVTREALILISSFIFNEEGIRHEKINFGRATIHHDGNVDFVFGQG